MYLQGFQQAFVLLVLADPEPDDIVAIHDTNHPIIVVYTG
jgi:hypothetical protein